MWFSSCHAAPGQFCSGKRFADNNDVPPLVCNVNPSLHRRQHTCKPYVTLPLGQTPPDGEVYAKEVLKIAHLNAAVEVVQLSDVRIGELPGRGVGCGLQQTSSVQLSLHLGHGCGILRQKVPAMAPKPLRSMSAVSRIGHHMFSESKITLLRLLGERFPPQSMSCHVMPAFCAGLLKAAHSDIRAER